MSLNISAGEKLAVVSIRNPATQANTEGLSTAVDMSKHDQVAFFLLLGDMSNETVDFRIEVSETSNFTPTKETLVAATQLAADASANDNKQLVLSCRASDLMAKGQNFRYARGRAVTGNTSGGPAAILGVAVDSRHEPGSDSDLASVLEIKVA
jgi:hypothetical protein